MREVTTAQVQRAIRRGGNKRFVPYFRVGSKRAKIGKAKIAPG
jgi:hypothetical protein